MSWRDAIINTILFLLFCVFFIAVIAAIACIAVLLFYLVMLLADTLPVVGLFIAFVLLVVTFKFGNLGTK